MKLVKALCLLPFLALGCFTPEHKVEEVDTSLEAKGKTDSGTIGINDKGQAIIQTENSAAEELKIQKVVNEELEAKLNHEHAGLKRCRKDMADERLGGNNELPEMTGVDDLKEATEMREEMGLNEGGDYKVVKKEYFEERLQKERKYEKSLRKMLKLYTNQRERCELAMASARSKAGLSAKRKDAKGHFTSDGTWVEEEKGEQDLNDAVDQKEKPAGE